MITEKIREQLAQSAEAEYQSFQAKLLPGVDGILGVRLPQLRQLAKQTAKQDALAYLQEMKELTAHGTVLYYEEKMLFGLVTGYARMDDPQRKYWLDVFVPVIDSWGVCDSCCMTYKWMKKQPEFWWEYLNKWLSSETEYGIRFGFVSMLAHFVDEEHLRQIFACCSQTRPDKKQNSYQDSYQDNNQDKGYYAKMAQAWLISVCFAKFPDQTYAFLKTDTMDDFTHNKSIQKTCESYRVSKEWKAAIRSLRR